MEEEGFSRASLHAVLLKTVKGSLIDTGKALNGSQSDVLVPQPQKSEIVAKVGDTVFTPYGIGEVIAVNADRPTPYQVRLSWGATAYLSSVKPKKKLFQMNDTEKGQAAQEHKEKGKTRFLCGDYRGAIREYELALIYARQIKEPQLLHQLETEVAIPCYQNLAMCHIKTHEFGEAVEAASQALKLNAQAIKALFFRGRANRLRAMYQDAKRDLMEALNLDSSNVDVRKELQELKAALQKASQTEKKMFTGIFGGQSATKEEEKETSEDSETLSPSHKRPHEDVPTAVRKKSRTDLGPVPPTAITSVSKTPSAEPSPLSLETNETTESKTNHTTQVALAVGALAVFTGVLVYLARRKSS